MKAWLLSIAAISILSAVADMLLPATSTSRYAKLCIGILLTTVIITPMIRLDASDINIKLPEIAQTEADSSYNIVDKEFSARFTELLKNDTGYLNISAQVKLGHDRIEHVEISGAHQDEIQDVNKVLLEKYNISTEIVTYGSN